MSVLGFLGYTLLLCAAAAGGWKGALYWHVRNRDARDEDPRDQEIRELGAALSIARKELANISDAKEAHSSAASELTSKLEHASSSLSDIQQKFNATKDHLNKEIEDKQELTEELTQLRRDLEQSQTRITELEVQAKIENSASGMIAGMDMLSDDDAELEMLRAQHSELTAELERWKAHCATLTKTNKSLRRQSSPASANIRPTQQ